MTDLVEYKYRMLSELDASHNRNWEGSSKILLMYRMARGCSRDEIIGAIKEIIKDADEQPAILAELLHIAMALDIAQIDEDVIALRSKSISKESPLCDAIRNYEAAIKVACLPGLG